MNQIQRRTWLIFVWRSMNLFQNMMQFSTKQGQTGPPGNLALARWAGWSVGQVGRHVNVEQGSGTEDGTQWPLARERGLYSDKLFAGASEFLVTPLLMGPVCLVSQDRSEEPVRFWHQVHHTIDNFSSSVLFH